MKSFMAKHSLDSINFWWTFASSKTNLSKQGRQRYVSESEYFGKLVLKKPEWRQWLRFCAYFFQLNLRHCSCFRGVKLEDVYEGPEFPDENAIIIIMLMIMKNSKKGNMCMWYFIFSLIAETQRVPKNSSLILDREKYCKVSSAPFFMKLYYYHNISVFLPPISKFCLSLLP